MLVEVAPGKVEGTSRFSGLDGLRALAVAAVVLFHADFDWARGGYLGVDLFFVISGFLITNLIAREVDSTGRLSLRAFYWRRAKRLLPASLLMTAIVVVVAALIAPDALPHLRRDVVASLAYVTNWELLRSETSYFAAMGRPPLLQHLWSLAIEEQFYLVWAPLSLFVLARFGRRRLKTIAIAMAATSVVAMWALATHLGYPAQGDPSRLYFGTDAHGFALLLGAALGLGRQPSATRAPTGSAVRAFAVRGLIWLLGMAALSVMLLLFANLGENHPFLYPWGFLLTATTAIALIAAATHPAVRFGRLLDNAPMRWIGARSYGIYLWHWPVFMLTRPGADLHLPDDDVVFVLRLILTLALAECSYRYLETPVRTGLLERIFATRFRRAWPKQLAVVSTALTTALAMGTILWDAPVEALPAQDVRDAFAPPVVAPQAAKSLVGVARIAKPQVTVDEANPVDEVHPAVGEASDEMPDHPELPAYSGTELTAVGDSVMLGSSRLLKAFLPGTDLHATMGWQAADVIRQLQSLKKSNALRPVVLVHLGTNGYVTEEQLRHMLAMLSDCKRVVLVNTRVPRRWMAPNNALIERVAPDFPNVRIVHWSDSSKGRSEYFISDRVHLTTAGQRALIADIMRVGRLEHHLPNVSASDIAQSRRSDEGDFSPTLVIAAQSAGNEHYWRKIAQCETDANWHDDIRLLGGLDIGLGAWSAWGGEEFAPTPSEATPGQQIEVANRISTQGWKSAERERVGPIGFDHWKCVAAMGRPPTTSLFTYTPESVLKQTFHPGERGEVVRDLQRILGEKRDGVYSKALRRKHVAYLQKNAMSEDLAATDP